MRDKLLIVHATPADEYYKHRDAPPMGWPKRRVPTVEQLDRAHDNIRKLVAEKDRIIAAANAQAEVLEKERKWRKWILGAFGFTWLCFYGVLKFMIPYVIKGMLGR